MSKYFSRRGFRGMKHMRYGMVMKQNTCFHQKKIWKNTYCAKYFTKIITQYKYGYYDIKMMLVIQNYLNTVTVKTQALASSVSKLPTSIYIMLSRNLIQKL